MSTKKFKIGNADGNNVKGGKNNTRTILTAAGMAAFGAATGGGGYFAGATYGHHHSNEEEKLETKVEENPEEKPETQDNQQTDTSSLQQGNQQSQPQNGDNITEPQPTDTTTQTQQVNNDQTDNNNGGHGHVVEQPEVNPDDIAQDIIQQQNIDPNDIDSPTIISVDELATLYREDGSEILVAAIHTPDGAQYVLADYDGDGYFTDVFDMAGNYVGEAEGNLMASDLEAMVDETGGYLAADTEEPQGDDPTNDIIDTSHPSSSVGEEIAGNSLTVPASADDEINDEELYAQLSNYENEDNESLINLDSEDDELENEDDNDLEVAQGDIDSVEDQGDIFEG